MGLRTRRHVPDTDLDRIETVLQNGDIAAAIIEPSADRGDAPPCHASFCPDCVNAHTFDVPLILRDCHRFSLQPGSTGLFDVLPDLPCLAKIVAGDARRSRCRTGRHHAFRHHR
ncbi:MAG: hypothetical protein CM1200mP2_29290 [Planctomycetaceae bacterium]|nr:MAG: hypothetical protein CM1200mP2_29290 [Planctomycetaceae bacterium]